MVLGSLCSMGDLTPSAGAVLSHPYPCGSMLKPGRGSTHRVWGGSWCAMGSQPVSRCCWSQERGEITLHVPALLPAWGSRAGSAPCFYLFIYRRNSSGRNIPETLLAAPALWWDDRHAAAALADPPCHAHPVPTTPWSPKVCGVRGHCATVLALCLALYATGMRFGGKWGGSSVIPIVPKALSRFYHNFLHGKFSVWLFYPYHGDGAVGVPHCGGPQWPWGEGLYPVGSAAGVVHLC